MKKKIKFTVVKKFMDFKKRHKDHTEYVNLDYYRLLELLSLLHLDNHDFEYKTKFFPATPKWFTTNIPFSLVARYIVTFPISSKKREVYMFDRCGVGDEWEITIYSLNQGSQGRILCYPSAHDSGFDSEFVIRWIDILKKKPCSEIFNYQYQFLLELQKEEEEVLEHRILSDIDTIELLKESIETNKSKLELLQSIRNSIELFLKENSKENQTLGYNDKEE